MKYKQLGSATKKGTMHVSSYRFQGDWKCCAFSLQGIQRLLYDPIGSPSYHIMYRLFSAHTTKLNETVAT